MGKDFHDFAEDAVYFSTNKAQEELSKAEAVAKKQTKFIFWLQGFSKILVSVVFIVYVAGMLYYCYLIRTCTSEMISGIDTFLTELNQTFRDVAIGYVIKAAVENAVKIGGNYLVGITDAKLVALRDRMGISGNATESAEVDFNMDVDDSSNDI